MIRPTQTEFDGAVHVIEYMLHYLNKLEPYAFNTIGTLEDALEELPALSDLEELDDDGKV